MRSVVFSLAGVLSGGGLCAGSPCPADLAEPYGVVNFFDVTAYVALFEAGSPAADRAEPFGVLNFFDLAAYINAFNAGCTSDLDGDRIPDVFETDTGMNLGPETTGTDPKNPDTDGDGIIDGDEVYGTVEGLDLPAMGANPFVRDIFIECDWFAGQFIGRFRDYRPTAASVARVVNAFAAAPVPNPYFWPDGVSIHLDYGQGGAFTGGNQLPGNPVFVVFDDEFNAYKAQHFDPRRKGYFHYAVFASRYNFASNGSSGFAEINGDDFMVTMVDYLSDYNQSQTIMHELGHNLGLRHGGFENRNYKPNFNSVMNYRHQFAGADTDGDSRGNGALDYSRGINLALDEGAIDEVLGVAGVPIDFDLDATIDLVPYALNINCPVNTVSPCDTNPTGACADAACTVLLDHDDWGAINWNRLTASFDRTGPQEVVECDSRP